MQLWLWFCFVGTRCDHKGGAKQGKIRMTVDRSNTFGSQKSLNCNTIRHEGISILNHPALAPSFYRVFSADLISQTSQNLPVLMLVSFFLGGAGESPENNDVILKKSNITKVHLTFDLPWSSLSLDVERNDFVTERNELWFMFCLCFVSCHVTPEEVFIVSDFIQQFLASQKQRASSIHPLSNKIPRVEIFTEFAFMSHTSNLTCQRSLKWYFVYFHWRFCTFSTFSFPVQPMDGRPKRSQNWTQFLPHLNRVYHSFFCTLLMTLLHKFLLRIPWFSDRGF